MKAARTLLPRIRRPWPWLAGSAAVLVAGLVLEPQRALAGLLTVSIAGVQLTAGALLWIALLTVSGAKWWLPVRRHFAALAERLMVPAAAAAITAVAGMTVLYPWAQPGAAQRSHLLHEKAAWLNPTFFGIRAVAVLLLWLAVTAGLTAALRRWMAGAPKVRSGVTRLSAIALVVLALTISIAFWDWTMSLEPEWFSTMYGVYGFSGALQGGIAAVAALAVYSARRDGDKAVGAAVRHDFGRLVFGFSFFWGYIWFCQYMLIWYANLPEEVGHYVTRTSAAWGTLFWLNVVLNFAVPFFVLLPAGSKRHEAWLLQISLLVMLARPLDVYLLVEPSLLEAPSLPLYPLAAAILLITGTLAFAHRRGSPARSGTARKGRTTTHESTAHT